MADDVKPPFVPPVKEKEDVKPKADRKALEREADAAKERADDAAKAKEEADREAAEKAQAAGRVPDTGPLVNPGPPKPEEKAAKPRKAFRVLSDGLGLWRKGYEFNKDELPEGANLDRLIDLKAVEPTDNK